MGEKTVNKRGQSLILVAFAIFALIGFVGLGVDLGMSYIARVRIRRAVDAASLAAASELPLERLAHARALEYLAENQYDCGLELQAGAVPTCNVADARVEINTADDGGDNGRDAYVYTTGPDAEDAEFIIQIDTSEFADVQGGDKQLDSATRIRVSVSENVELYFMKIFGFDSVPIYASAVAENISDLDVVLIFDRSGSMEFDTRCYGCWTSTSGKEYPDGTYWFLPWGDDDGDGVPAHCEGSDPYEEGGDQYIIIEAEDYSRLSNAYQRDLMDIGQTFWVLGRNGGQANSWMGNSGSYLGRDSYDAYLSYAPARTYIGADGYGVPCFWSDLTNQALATSYGINFPEDRVCSDADWVKSQGGPFAAPRADYGFSIPDGDGGQWAIWVRAKGGGSHDAYSGSHWFFWGMSDDGDLFDHYELVGRENYLDSDGGFEDGAASGGSWGWYILGTGNDDNNGLFHLDPGNYTLHLWGGTPGVDIDRIVITTYDNITACDEGNEKGCNIWDDDFQTILEDESEEVFDNNRTGWACDPCDARYGGRPDPAAEGLPQLPVCTTDMMPQPHRYLDDLYDDEQPIRASVEAAKGFVRKLNPRFDQVGLVTYSGSARIDSKLECVRRLGRDNCTMDILENTIIEDLDSTHAGGSTNIADAIQDGITVLSNRSGQYGRPGAAHIMILMTDGEANTGSCGESSDWPNDDQRAKDCVIVRAREARNNGIVIYTITLGAGADIELLSHVADMTGGIHRHTPSPEQLEPIFDELYSRIFLRIVE